MKMRYQFNQIAREYAHGTEYAVGWKFKDGDACEKTSQHGQAIAPGQLQFFMQPLAGFAPSYFDLFR